MSVPRRPGPPIAASRRAARATGALLAAALAVPALALSALLATTPGRAAAADAADPVLAAPVPAPTLESSTTTGYRVRVPIGEAQVARARVAGYDLAEVLVSGGAPESQRGQPSLPTRVVLLRIPWGVTPAVRGSRQGERSLGALTPAPVPGLVTQPSVEERVPAGAIAGWMESAAYRALGPAGEAPAIARAVPMAAGGQRYLAVTLRPVRWDPLTREAWVADAVTLDVSWGSPVTALPENAPLPAPSSPAARALARAAVLDIPGAVGPRYAPRIAGTAGSGGARPPRAAGLGRAAAAAGPLRVDLSRPWVRLGVVRPGLYRITQSDLLSAGIATGGIDPATFRLFRSTPGDLPESLDVDTGPDSLRECAITVTGEGDGSFDPGDTLYFYATGETGFGYDLKSGGGAEYQETQRTDQEPLWLTWGAGPVPTPPRRIPVRDAAPVDPTAPLLTQVTHRVHYEQNQFAAFNLFQPPLRWERWFMNLLAVPPPSSGGSQGVRLAFPIALPGGAPGGASSARARMWGNSTSLRINGFPDHKARLWWNGAVVDSAGWNFLLAQDLIASGLRTNGARDTLQIEVPLYVVDPRRPDFQYLAWFEVSYPRRLAAAADTLDFAAPDSVPSGRFRYAISAVSDTSSAWLLDRADPESPVRLVGGSWSGSAPSFTWTVEDSAGPGYRPRYSLVSTARAARPALALYAPASSPHALADLLDPANAADYLVIAPPTFLEAAESLAVDRSTRLSGIPDVDQHKRAPIAAIATTDRIAAQLGGGRPDPVAIRNLLALATRWTVAPAYVCILGDASDDPKNYLRVSAPDLVPVYNAYYDVTLGEQFISDDFYALLDGPGDQLVDLALGRITAQNPAEALGLVRGKRATYERTADFDWWRARALLSADDAWKWSYPDLRDPVGPEHVPEMEGKDAFHIPFPVRREKVYLNDYAFADSTKQSKPKAREAYIAGVNAGNWVVDFAGHGNANKLADEELFSSTYLARLTNATRPSIFGFFSCTVGKFDDNVEQDDLAEALLRDPTGGAVVSLAASGFEFGFQSSLLNNAFMDGLFPAAPRADTLRTAGLAWALAKDAPGNQNVWARKYSYLGDPALLPPLPRGRAVWEKSPADSVARGEIASIRGHALNEDGTPDTLTTGTVLLEALGPLSRRIEIAWRNGTEVAVPYALPGPVLYRGEAALDRGAFTLRFAVPTDGRLIGPGAQIRALLSSAGGQGVGLAADSLRIGASLSPRVDATPPSIRLLLLGPGNAGADSTVAPGALLTFAIEDSSGIDLTRLDDAHSIFVIVDDRGTPIDMTPTFRYEPGSYTSGTATLVVPPLAAGAHLLEVHASDTFRNVGVASFTIEVAAPAGPGVALTLSEVFNYPNPFPRETFLHARLNRAARLRAQIFTVAGRRVRDLAVDGKAGENYIPWDGRDSEGEKVAIGVYIVKLTAEASGGDRASAIARALRSE